MHKYAIEEMTPHFFLLTGQRHPIACLRQLVSSHILPGEFQVAMMDCKLLAARHRAFEASERSEASRSSFTILGA